MNYLNQNRGPIKPQQIGFLMGPSARPPYTPFQAPPSPFMSSPFSTGGMMPPPMQGPIPPTGGFGGAGLGGSGFGGGGLGGMLQGLLGGGGSGLDLQSMLGNAQKMMGLINQVGPIVKNLSPMLQLLQGFNASGSTESNDILTEIPDEKPKATQKKRKRRRKKKGNKRKRNTATFYHQLNNN